MKVIVLGNLPLATKIIKFLNRKRKVSIEAAIHPRENKRYNMLADEECAFKYCKSKGIKNISTEDVLGMDNLDLAISARHNEILSKSFIDKFSKGVVNCHGGYIPEHKGVGGHLFPLMNKKDYTGATIHYMDEKIDHGPIIERKKISIRPHDTGISLFYKINKQLFKMIRKKFDNIIKENVGATPQSSLKSNKKENIYLQKDIKRVINKDNKNDIEKRASYWPSKIK
ncbi:formyltransferase family protein [Salinibacter ruber]|uniref:formyltransferase family protein n=1 Tax=Salinibacter ruber TaxID=146919 RepID=UPI002169ABBE|nr:formyltransferase family protein [Salinibacter ruber]MCS4049221.1 phosphoribosylglycinamide formyltransferase-1 [Salinibacter ruber]